jgi:hypothetical protein
MADEGRVFWRDNDTGVKPEDRRVRGAVGWLLGPELIGRLRQTFRRRANVRQWMPYLNYHLHDETRGGDGVLRSKHAQTDPGLENSHRPSTQSGRPIVASGEAVVPPAAPIEDDPRPEIVQGGGTTNEDVWFDYAADMGDSVDSMYAVAYGLMISFKLPVDKAKDEYPYAKDEPVPDLTTDGTWPGRRKVKLEIHDKLNGLPRGQFVFIGGDTAYHVADSVTLRSRVEEPFVWAWEDARARGQLCEADRDPLASSDKDPEARKSRRLYGIPGNHDWYDNLDGFSVMFRVGAPASTVVPVKRKVIEPMSDDKLEAIDLPHLRRRQLASYMGIQLPYEWQLWGLDLDSPLDRRQQEYFLGLHETSPKNLIVVTPSPAIVFEARSPDKNNHDEAMKRVGVEVPSFAEMKSPTGPAFAGARLEISGDVHHYARYFPTPEVSHYGSVVSGLGGVFHHPSFTRARNESAGIEAKATYPEKGPSKARISRGLLTWRSAWFGSWGRVVPLLLAVICGFAARAGGGGAWMIHSLLANVGYSEDPKAGSATLHVALATLAGIVASAIVAIVALRYGIYIFEHHEKNAGAARNIGDIWASRKGLLWRIVMTFSFRRSYWFAWVLGVLAFAPMLAAPYLAEIRLGATTPSLGLDVAVLVIFLLVAVGGVAGWKVAGKLLAPTSGRKWLLLLLGTVHAAAHVGTAIVIATAGIASWEATAACVSAVVVVPLLLHAGRFVFCGSSLVSAILLAIIAMVVMGATLFGILMVAKRATADPEIAGLLIRIVICAVCGMLLGTMWFVWYLAAALRLEGHNNEAGGAARVTTFRQFIRFHVHAGGLTGYVISVETESDTEFDKAPPFGTRILRTLFRKHRPKPVANRTEPALAFHLIDVFTVTPK